MSNNLDPVQAFLNEAPQIAFKTSGPISDYFQFQGTINNIITQGSGNGSTLSTFLFSFNASNPLPSTASAFFSQLQSATLLSDADLARVLNTFQDFYRTAVNSSTDLGAISPPPTTDQLNAQFTNAFGAFLQHFPYSSLNSVSTGPFTFAWNNFLTRTAVLNNSTDSNINNFLQSYQQIFRGFLGNDNTLFSTLLTKFYNSELIKIGNGNPNNGYFLPSQALSDWVTFVQKFIPGNPVNLSSVTTSSSVKVQILEKIFLLLVQMIGSIQNVAAAQAARLNVLSQWQRAYTAEENQIHFFAGSNSDGIISNSIPSARNIRDSLNQTNQTFTQQMQGNNSVVQDEAKALQSNVNQSNDAANQQSTLADGIIQTFGTIISSIFR